MSIEQLLNEEIESELAILNETRFGTDEYKQAIDGVTKLLDRHIELKKLEQDADNKELDRMNDKDFKEQQLEEEKKDRWIRNGIAIGGIVLPLGVTIWGALKSWEFEKSGTVTTMMGRGFIGKLISKK